MILVSDSFLEDKAESLWTYKVSVIYDEEYDKETEKKVKELIQESKDAKDITWSSKLKGIKEQKPAEQKMWQLGMGIAIVLGFIGVMNYINTELGSISGRRREIAILESIGMTGKQQRRLLLTEGMYYAGISLFLTATVGLGIDVLLFQRMNYHKVAFSIPVIPVVCHDSDSVCTVHFRTVGSRQIYGRRWHSGRADSSCGRIKNNFHCNRFFCYYNI